MEKLEREDKTTSVTFKVTPKMKREIEDFCKERNWKLSAFIRVAIVESMEKVAGNEIN